MARLETLGMDFADLFAGARGDLIYGMSRQRDRYKAHYQQETGNEIENDSWWSMDQYNDTLGLSSPMMRVEQLDAFIVYDQANPTTVTSRVFHGDILQRIVATPRRDPHKIFDIDPEKLKAMEGIPLASELQISEEQRYARAVSWKSIRRACKFGIEYVVAKHARFGTIIHFIIDGLEDRDILTKRKFRSSTTGRAAVPITTSELRNVFRRWHLEDFNEAVYFYKDFVHVRAPWETNPRAWQKYAEARLGNYKNDVKSMLNLDRYRPYRMEVQRLLAAARAAEGLGQRSVAVDALRDAKELLEGLNGGSSTPTPLNGIAGESGQTLLIHVRRALEKYGRRGLFSRQGRRTRDALPHLNRIVERNIGDSLIRALHWFMNIAPSNRMVLTTRLPDRLSRTGRLSSLLEKEYIHWRFDIQID